MNEKNKINPVWDELAIKDLKRVYKFNKKNFSLEFARKIRKEIFDQVGSLGFSEQWQVDEFLGEPYRRIVVRHYKIVYKVLNENNIAVLMVFDTRQDPVKYNLKK